MEPNFKQNNYEDNSEFIDEMGFQNDPTLKQDHFLSLRKNKRINLQIKRLEKDNTSEKYKLNQNSYDKSNEIIQQFFATEDKPAFLYQLLSNISNSNTDLNLLKFIIVQSFNYYQSQKKNLNILEKFFTEPIISNLINVMYNFKNDLVIVYNICFLLVDLTYRSSQLTKLITLNVNNIQKIFECLAITDNEVNSIVLNLLYNCYMEDEDTVNKNCNIGVYVFGQLNNYSSNIKNILKANINKDEILKILVAFLEILINNKTSAVYKKFDFDMRNNIIYLLLILCKKVLDENLKLDSHKGLERMLSLAESEQDINVDKIGLCNIESIFLPHIKLESNSPEIVQYSMKIIEQFSYLFDVEVFIDTDLIDQLEQILITFNDMNTNKINPKPFYDNYKKKNISKILNNLVIILINTITLPKYEKYIIRETNIIENLTLCLRIFDLENETINNIYAFFKDFISNKDNCVKVILSNFIDIGIIDMLKANLYNKNYEVIKSVLDICLLIMKKCDELTDGKPNIIKIYLEKKGFNEILTLISGDDFGNMNCSEIAKNIQDNFFVKK